MGLRLGPRGIKVPRRAERYRQSHHACRVPTRTGSDREKQIGKTGRVGHATGDVPIPHRQKAIHLCQLIGWRCAELLVDRQAAVNLLVQRATMNVQRPRQRIAEACGHLTAVLHPMSWRPGFTGPARSYSPLQCSPSAAPPSRHAPLMPTSTCRSFGPTTASPWFSVHVTQHDQSRGGRQIPELVAETIPTRDRDPETGRNCQHRQVSTGRPEIGAVSPVYLAKMKGTPTVAANRSVTP